MFQEMWRDPVCRFALKVSAVILVGLLLTFGPVVWPSIVGSFG